MKKAFLVLAVSLAAVTSAHASIQLSSANGGVTSNFTGGANIQDSILNGKATINSGSEFLFSSWTETASYSLDLGITFDAIYDGDIANGTSWNLADYNVSGDLQWNVGSFSTRTTYLSPTTVSRSRYGIISTVTNEQTTAANFTASTLGTSIGNLSAFVANLNGTDTTVATNNHFAINDNTSAQYAGKGSYADGYGGLLQFGTSGVEGDTLLLQFLGLDATGLVRTPVTLGSFTLNGTTLTYNTAPEVPVPAAFWLMGSALAGLGAVARRRNRNQA